MPKAGKLFKIGGYLEPILKLITLGRDWTIKCQEERTEHKGKGKMKSRQVADPTKDAIKQPIADLNRAASSNLSTSAYGVLRE